MSAIFRRDPKVAEKSHRPTCFWPFLTHDPTYKKYSQVASARVRRLDPTLKKYSQVASTRVRRLDPTLKKYSLSARHRPRKSGSHRIQRYHDSGGRKTLKDVQHRLQARMVSSEEELSACQFSTHISRQMPCDLGHARAKSLTTGN